MTGNQAKTIAKDYLTSHPIGHPDYVWIVGEPRETALGWYFDFRYECLLDLPPENREMFGGAPGFIVRPDRTVQVVGWDEWPAIQDSLSPLS